MKVKQLLKHFWHGASSINSVEIVRMGKRLVVLTDTELSEGHYGEYEMERVNIFLVDGNTMKIYIE